MTENKSYADMRMAQNENNPAEGKMYTMCENAEHFFCICQLNNHKPSKHAYRQAQKLTLSRPLNCFGLLYKPQKWRQMKQSSHYLWRSLKGHKNRYLKRSISLFHIRISRDKTLDKETLWKHMESTKLAKYRSFPFRQPEQAHTDSKRTQSNF